MKKAVASNFDVTSCYQDIGYSGSNMKRPALQRMLQDYKDGKFSIVLVYNRDRLIKGNPIDIPTWPFPVLSATPSSDFERESIRIARYIRASKAKEKTLIQQHKAVRCAVKKHGYR
jgi:DNA invertase Pin-like site-specific DNA recombinase